MIFKYKLAHPDTKAPKREYDSAGWDIFCDHDITVEANKPTLIQTGIKVQDMSKGWVAFLKQKSGIALKKGWIVHGGVIDWEYRGKIGVILECSTVTELKRGDPIAQMVFLKVPDEVTVCESDTEAVTDRMEGGFGSTTKSR
jgi:deoxyuridine 5'-triphosphate nucleotidohydrolase